MDLNQQSIPRGNPGFQIDRLVRLDRSTFRGNEVPMRIPAMLVGMCRPVVKVHPAGTSALHAIIKAPETIN